MAESYRTSQKTTAFKLLLRKELCHLSVLDKCQRYFKLRFHEILSIYDIFSNHTKFELNWIRTCHRNWFQFGPSAATVTFKSDQGH